MSVVDDFLKKMHMVNDDDYDDYDDYDEYDEDEEDDEILNPKKKSKVSFFGGSKRSKVEEEDDYDDLEDDVQDDLDDLDDYDTKPSKKENRPVSVSDYKSSYSQGSKSQTTASAPQKKTGAASAEVCMIMPKSFEDANTIADVLLSHKAVVLNLEGIDMAAAQRIIDFASGSCYTVGGNLQKISKKIFIVVPSDMNLSGDFDQLIGDMIDLNSVNMLK